MKINVKRALLALCLVAVVMVGSIAGTIAWLTDATESVENTFTVGDIEITLTESDDLDLKIIPGKTITKDPKVTVEANSEACWLFVKIEKNNWDATNLSYAIADGWTELETGVYYRQVDKDTAAAGVTYPVLKDNQVVVSDELTADIMEGYETAAPKLTFTAYACQSENVDSAADAWDKINAQ